MVFQTQVQHLCSIKMIQCYDDVCLFGPKSKPNLLSYLVEEDSVFAAGDVEGLLIAGLNHQVTNLPLHLPPRRAATAIGKFIICA